LLVVVLSAEPLEEFISPSIFFYAVCDS
jgi:hypothetical protein